MELGWPAGYPVEVETAREVLNAAVAGAPAAILKSVVRFARALPVADETLNDAIYAA